MAELYVYGVALELELRGCLSHLFDFRPSSSDILRPSWALTTNMPVYIAVQALSDGIDSIPYIWPVLKTVPWLGALYLLKLFFSGASNGSERNMHAKVVLVTVRASCHLGSRTRVLRNGDRVVRVA